MQAASLAFRVHSGWAALVAVSLNSAGARRPEILLRQRPHLVETFSYVFRQPYHTAEKMLRETHDLAASSRFIVAVQKTAQELAVRAIRSARQDLARAGYRLDRCVILQAAGRPLPALDRILAAHALIHAADGELFRKALQDGAKRTRVRVVAIPERGLIEAASLALHIPGPQIPKRLTALGKSLGPPWSHDEKFAALAGWLALSPRRKG